MSELSRIVRHSLFTILYVAIHISYVIVLCVESRLSVKEISESTAEAAGQNEQFFASSWGQFFVEIVVDADTSVIAQSVDILLAKRPYTRRKMIKNSWRGVSISMTNLDALCGFEVSFCAILVDGLSCERLHGTMDIAYRDEPPSKT